MLRLYKLFSKLRSFGERDSFSDAEVSALALNLLTNYRKSNSAIKSLQISLDGDRKYCNLASYVSKYRLSSLSNINETRFSNRNLNILLGILGMGIRKGADVTKSLEDFLEWIDLKIEKENKVRSRVHGMQVLSLLGIVFFFPLFSGITASIVRSSLTGSSANATVSGLRIIGMGYILLATLITNSLLYPSRKLLSAAWASIPLASLGWAIQTSAYALSSYAL